MAKPTLPDGYIAHAPGFIANDGPKLITGRFGHEDSFMLERFLAACGELEAAQTEY